MSAALCFGAGALFETAILHIYNDAQKSQPCIAPLAFCLSFIFLYTVDEVFHFCYHYHDTHDDPCHNRFKCVLRKLIFWKPEPQPHLLPAYDQSSFDSEDNSSSPDTVFEVRERSPIVFSSSKNYGSISRSFVRVDNNHDKLAIPSTSQEPNISVFSHSNIPRLNYSKSSPTLSSLTQGHTQGRSSSNLTSVRSVSNVLNNNALNETERILERRLSMQQRRQECCEYNEVSGIGMNETISLPSNSIIGHLGLLFGLCLHFILESIPIGSEKIEYETLIIIAAMATQKVVIAFYLGMELANTNCRWFWIFLQSIGYSLSLPGGLFIGGMITDNEIFHLLIAPILQAIAGGTIFYAALCEILPRERLRWHHNKTRKAGGIALLLSFTVGFVAMYGLSILIDHYQDVFSANN
ncbi:hypothetical protein L9F63_000985 [Diploptera punctata]|uniref:Uncharacterized protein n=1 Tax=Diploptera punctata TaxID=6984 RepID=A0AAD8AKM4_DIPPU|nr:hypothetical protein L9F63_000985 [Diploptera punctata]